jgi:plasmid stabilization system protein ParE
VRNLPFYSLRILLAAHPAIRFFPVRRFRNHIIVFLPLADGVEIVRVVDGRRDLRGMFDEI